ncbi:hypothetical protein FHS85_001879 [Rhodoligotrophos appendicifer]
MSIYITEFASIASDGSANLLNETPREPAIASRKIATSATAVLVTMNSDTRFVRVIADSAVCIAIGTSPVATTSDRLLPANAIERVHFPDGYKLSVIAAS